jgi:hypothetical protein
VHWTAATGQKRTIVQKPLSDRFVILRQGPGAAETKQLHYGIHFGKRFKENQRDSMSIIESHLLSATGSFGFTSAYAMLQKASREYSRCRDAQSNDDRCDAAINAAITLWHMNDWVWNGITVAGRDKLELKRLLNVPNRSVKKDDFVSWAVSQCPELEICQSICNGSKHVVCRGITEARMTSANGQALGRLEIVDDAQAVHDAMDVLLKALTFWHYHATTEALLR